MATITIDGEQFDMLTGDSLTMGEAKVLQRMLGCKMAQLDMDDVEHLQALIWMSWKRVRPNLLLAELDELPFAAFDIQKDLGEDEDPTPPGDPVNEGQAETT